MIFHHSNEWKHGKDQKKIDQDQRIGPRIKD